MPVNLTNEIFKLQDAEFDFGDVDSFFVSGYKFADTPDDFTSWPF